jgi:hypothetical protein
MKSNSNQEIRDDEISVKEVIIRIKFLYKMFVNNVISLTFMGLFGGAAGFFLASAHKPVFQAESHFIVKEGGATNIASSLGNLGALLGGSSGSSIDRTIAIMGSEKIISKVLLTPIIVNDVNDLAINHFVRLASLDKLWSMDSVLKKVHFSFSDTVISEMTYSNRKAIKYVLSNFVGNNGLVNKSFDKKSEIFSLTVTHFNEDFAIQVNRLILNELKIYFRIQATESSNLNVGLLTRKVDSIQVELNKVRLLIARRTDQSMGLLLNEDKIDLKSLAVKEQLLLNMYGEAQKNLETFLFMGQSASNSTAINLLDIPYSPLIPTSKNKVFYSVAGFIMTFFSAFGFILIRRWYKNLMAS